MTRNLLDCLIQEAHPRFFQDQNDVYYFVKGNGENEKSMRRISMRISIISCSSYMPNRNGDYVVEMGSIPSCKGSLRISPENQIDPIYQASKGIIK
jgi:hypothetical protein